MSRPLAAYSGATVRDSHPLRFSPALHGGHLRIRFIMIIAAAVASRLAENDGQPRCRALVGALLEEEWLRRWFAETIQ